MFFLEHSKQSANKLTVCLTGVDFWRNLPPISLLVSGLDGSGTVHTVLPWEAFGGHVPPRGSEISWFNQSNPTHRFFKRYMPLARSRWPRQTPMRRHGIPPPLSVHFEGVSDWTGLFLSQNFPHTSAEVPRWGRFYLDLRNAGKTVGGTFL